MDGAGVGDKINVGIEKLIKNEIEGVIGGNN